MQISEVNYKPGEKRPPKTFKAHDGAAWQVAWAHPKYESLLATCGYDKKVKIWRRGHEGDYEQLEKQFDLDDSVNCIAWAPWEYGLILAAGTAAGRVYIFSRQDSLDRDTETKWLEN